MAAAEGGDARVAGGGVELPEVRCLAELPGERMLASARADKEYLHTRTLPSALDGLESGFNRAVTREKSGETTSAARRHARARRPCRRGRSRPPGLARRTRRT